MARKGTLNERELEIQRVATAGQTEQLAVLLNSGWHHGKAGASQREKLLAAETIWDVYGAQSLAAESSHVRLPAELLDLTHLLARSFAPSARQVACALMQEMWKRDLALTPLMISLALDEDWEVREWAAGAFAALLREDFPHHVPFFHDLIERHPQESVLRQTALAIKQTAQARVAGSAGTLLELAAPLMRVEAEYVRKNLGPFAIGDGLLRIYPQETLSFLQDMSRDSSWPARWNAIMSFSAAQGARHADVAWDMLVRLQGDSQPEIVRAVRTTAKNLSKRLPEDERFRSFFARM